MEKTIVSKAEQDAVIKSLGNRFLCSKVIRYGENFGKFEVYYRVKK